MPALAVLNTTIATTDGTFRVGTINLDTARRLVEEANSIDSAVGHEATAAILTTLLGVEVPVVRQNFEQKPGQKALVFKLKGRGRDQRYRVRVQGDDPRKLSYLKSASPSAVRRGAEV